MTHEKVSLIRQWLWELGLKGKPADRNARKIALNLSLGGKFIPDALELIRASQTLGTQKSQTEK